MMKKTTFFVIGAAVFVVLALSFLAFQLIKTPEVGAFSAQEYQRELETFSSTSDVGELDTPQKAMKQAKALWEEKGFEPATKRIEIAYDQEAECWHVYSKPKANTLGGVAHAIIEKDGMVLAVWCEN